MSINIVKYDKEEMEFDLIGVSPAIANAFRRILISEVGRRKYNEPGLLFIVTSSNLRGNRYLSGR